MSRGEGDIIPKSATYYLNGPLYVILEMNFDFLERVYPILNYKKRKRYKITLSGKNDVIKIFWRK